MQQGGIEGLQRPDDLEPQHNTRLVGVRVASPQPTWLKDHSIF